MALRHENSGKETVNTTGESVKEIGNASRETDPGKLYKLSGVRGVHGVDRIVECRVIQTRMVVLHVRLLVGKNESGRDIVNVWLWRSGRGRCR